MIMTVTLPVMKSHGQCEHTVMIVITVVSVALGLLILSSRLCLVVECMLKMRGSTVTWIVKWVLDCWVHEPVSKPELLLRAGPERLKLQKASCRKCYLGPHSVNPVLIRCEQRPDSDVHIEDWHILLLIYFIHDKSSFSKKIPQAFYSQPEILTSKTTFTIMKTITSNWVLL